MTSLACAIATPLLCAGESLSGFTFSAFFGGAADWVQGSATWAWHQLGSWLGQTSDSKVVTTTARPVFDSLVLIAPFVALCAFCASAMGAVRRADWMVLARDAALAVPAIVLGIFFAPRLGSLILTAVDALGSGPAARAGGALTKLTTQAASLPSSIPAFGTLLLSLGEVIGAVLLWFELILRNAILALLLCLSPVVFAAAVWPPARRWALRLIESFVAVALAKFVIVVALALGATATQSDSATVVITGLAVVLLAVFAPFTLLRVVPLLEMSAVHALDGVRHRATAGARKAGNVASGAMARLAPIREPGPPEMPEDLGLENWPPGPPLVMPPLDGPRPKPPVGEPELRTGHVAYLRDEYGPVLGWHFDE